MRKKLAVMMAAMAATAMVGGCGASLYVSYHRILFL